MKKIFLTFFVFFSLNCQAKYLEIIGLTLNCISILQAYLSDEELSKINDVKEMIDMTIMSEIQAAKSCLQVAKLTKNEEKRMLLITNAYARISKAYGYFKAKHEKHFKKSQTYYPNMIFKHFAETSKKCDAQIKFYLKNYHTKSRGKARKRYSRSVKQSAIIYPYALSIFLKYQCENLLKVDNSKSYAGLEKLKTIILNNLFYSGTLHWFPLNKRLFLNNLWMANCRESNSSEALNCFIYHIYWSYSVTCFKEKYFNKSWFSRDLNKSIKAFHKTSLACIKKLELIPQEKNSFEVLLAYANVYLLEGKYKKALDTFKKVQEYNYSEDYIDNKYKKIINVNWFENRVINIFGYYKNYFQRINLGLGKIYSSLNKTEKAKLSFERYLSQNNYAMQPINDVLWFIYEHEYKDLIQFKHLETLAMSKLSMHIDTVAAIYAWHGQKEKALHYAPKGIKSTPKRVQMLLNGKTPKQVEAVLHGE